MIVADTAVWIDHLRKHSTLLADALDAHLLASVTLTSGALLLTHDRRLASVALTLRIAA